MSDKSEIRADISHFSLFSQQLRIRFEPWTQFRRLVVAPSISTVFHCDASTRRPDRVESLSEPC